MISKRFLSIFLASILISSLLLSVSCKKNDDKKKKKSIVDMNDADVEKIFEEWEENDEPLPDDEKPPHLRPKPKIDMNDIKGKDMDSIQMLNKKGQPLMIVVTVSGNPTQDETEKITSLWQSSLFNANLEVTRYVIDDKSAIFMVQDGSRSIEIKNFLVEQDRCLEVSVDSKKFPGKKNLEEWKKAEEKEKKKKEL